MLPGARTLLLASGTACYAAAGGGAAGAPPPGAGLSACSLPGHTAYPFCNTSLDKDTRVKDLIDRIHDEDKPNLLTARGGDNKMQALDYLGVPAYYWGQNCLHSAILHDCTKDGRCATNFPSGPNMAATFDTQLIQESAAIIATELRAAFNAKNWTDNAQKGLGLECWGPVLNLNRDPRWGRHGEGGAEDPLLMGALAEAWTKGLQEGEDSRFTKVAVTLKHYVANSVEGPWLDNGTWSPEGNISRHTIDANISKQTLADYNFKPYKAAIKAGAKGVMCSYNSVNGVPVCLDPKMKAARESWGFDGYVTSDSDSVKDAYVSHHYSPDYRHAAATALHLGGCDIDSGDTYFNSIPPALKDGLVSMDDVDQALFNSMRVRMDLGLFDPVDDQPYWKIGLEAIGTNASRAVNHRAASSSLVLLMNPTAATTAASKSTSNSTQQQRILPLQPGQHNIAVLGPHGNATNTLIQADTGRTCPNPDEVDYNCVETPVSAIRRYNGNHVTTMFEQGVSLASLSTAGIPAAVAAAKAADVVVMGLGIAECGNYMGDRTFPMQSCSSKAVYARYTEAEGKDRPDIGLPAAQAELAQQVVALNKSTVVFLLNGGMVALPQFLLDATNVAIVEAFYPGTEGSDALAQALFGQSNQWGRLPYTVYDSNFVDHFNMLDHDVVSTGATYRYWDYGTAKVGIQFPFGYGLSYSAFEVAAEAGSPADVTLFTNGTSPTHQVTVDVKNGGPLVGDCVVQGYFSPPRGVVPNAPNTSLFAFQRLRDVPVGAKAGTTAVFNLTVQDLLLATPEGDLVSAPGTYEVSFSTYGSAPDQFSSTSLRVELVGDQVTYEKYPATA